MFGLLPSNLLQDPWGGQAEGAHLAPNVSWEKKYRNLFLSPEWGREMVPLDESFRGQPDPEAPGA